MKLFGDMLESPDTVIISQEIQNIFESFVDKSVKYFIRTNQMMNPVDYEKDEDDQYEDEDEEAEKKPTKRPSMQKKWSNSKVVHSNWGDNISLMDADDE
jgi:hypothetical protein